jgi:hypothetical protein
MEGTFSECVTSGRGKPARAGFEGGEKMDEGM